MKKEESLQYMLDFMKGDQFGNHTGIELLDVKKGWARARMDIHPWHLNAVGIVHGGAIFTLADLAFAAASNSHGHAQVSVAINNSIAYSKALRTGVLYAECREITANAKLATYAAHITDEKGDIVAVFQGTVYKTQRKAAAGTP